MKIHIWRLIFNAIHVRTNLIHRGIEVEESFRRCKSYPEDINHTFWYCRFSRKLLKMSYLWLHLSGFVRGGFWDLFQWIVDKCGTNGLETFVLICWSLWIERNLIVF